MSDVFVSYSRRDRDVVAAIATALEAAGEDVWVDLEDIVPSALWMDEIKTAIAAADSVVFFLSPDSASSEVCRVELNYAVELSKRIVPVVIRETPPDSAPAPLPDINWHFVKPETFDADIAALVDVLNTDIARVHLHTRLLVRSTEWETRGGDASLLLRGSQLDEAEDWLAGQTDQKPTTTPAQARFITASRRAATRRQRGAILAGTAVTVVLAMVAALAIFQWHNATVQRNNATTQRNAAVSRELSAYAQSTLPSDPQLALILALRAYDSSPTTAARSAVRDAVRQSTLRAVLPIPDLDHAGAFQPSGDRVVAFGDHAVAVWNWTAPAGSPDVVRLPVDEARGDVMGAQFRSDGQVVFATRDGGVFAWNWADGTTPQTVRQIAAVARNPELAPGGTHVATVDLEPRDLIHITALDPTKRELIIAVGKPVNEIAFNYDATRLATNGSGDVAVWSIGDGTRLTTLPLGASDGGQMAFNPRDDRLAIGYLDTVKVVSMSSPANVTTLQITMPPGHSAHCCDVDEPVDLVWSPDGQALAAGTEDSTIRVWTGSSTTPVYLNGDTNAIGGVAFSADGKHLLSGGTHVEIWEWAAASTLTYAADSKPSPPVFSPDGDTVAAAEPSGDAFLLSTHTLQKQRLGRGIPLAFSPEGDHLAVEGPGAVTVWDTASQRQIAEFPIPNTNFATIPGYVYPWIEARFDPSGSVLAVLDKSALATTQLVRLMRWQWSAGLDATILTTTRRDQRFEALLSWGADDTVHFIEKGRDSVLKSWDGRQPPKVVATLPGEHGDIGRAAYLTPTKVFLDPGNRTQLWDLDTGTLNPVLPDYGSSQFALSGDREMLAVSADYGTVNLWDLQPGNDPVRVGTYSVAPHIAINHGGTLVVVADQAGTHLVPTKFAAKFPVVLELARRLVVRSLTADEEKQYLPSS